MSKAKTIDFNAIHGEFEHQRELLTATNRFGAVQGIQSYAANLGFDAEDLIAWSTRYVEDNLTEIAEAAGERAISMETVEHAMLTAVLRALTLGVVLGRDHHV